jgi:hypothetical protein
MNGEELKRALRELFEAQVINHGDYSLVYGEPAGPGPGWVLGYRHTPLELVLCPVQVKPLAQAGSGGRRVEARPAAPVSSVSLMNVATVADTGTGYQVQSVTGYRASFEVEAAPRVSAGAAAGSGDGTVVLGQGQDAENFHQFMGHFMDTLDAFYQVPDTAAFEPVLTPSH